LPPSRSPSPSAAFQFRGIRGRCYAVRRRASYALITFALSCWLLMNYILFYLFARCWPFGNGLVHRSRFPLTRVDWRTRSRRPGQSSTEDLEQMCVRETNESEPIDDAFSAKRSDSILVRRPFINRGRLHRLLGRTAPCGAAIAQEAKRRGGHDLLRRKGRNPGCARDRARLARRRQACMRLLRGSMSTRHGTVTLLAGNR
jgi:hypothetical protein